MVRIEGRTDQAAVPAGPYSQSVQRGALVMSAGQTGTRPDGTVADSVEEQTTQSLQNVMGALAARGATEPDILSVRVYLTDIEHFAAMNEVYRTFFSEPYPARTTVYVGLPPGLLVEIDALAVLDEPSRS